MRRSIFNVFTVAAGAVLVAALGVSAHAQISNGLTRAGVHGQSITLHTEKGEVASEARDAEPKEVPEQKNPQPKATDEPEAQDNEAADNETETGDNTDEQGDNNDTGGAGGGSGGGENGGD
jgi:hypothetical protein